MSRITRTIPARSDDELVGRLQAFQEVLHRLTAEIRRRLNNLELVVPDVDGDECGLTLDRIKRFSSFNADQKSVDDGCAICIDGVEMNKLMIRLECNHFYCNECIRKWFEKNVSCPVCRKEYYN